MVKASKCRQFLHRQARSAFHFLIKVQNQIFHVIDEILYKVAPKLN